MKSGGNPTVYDRLMATEFVINAVDKLTSQKTADGLVVVYKNAKFEFKSIEYVNSESFKIKEELLALASKMLR